MTLPEVIHKLGLNSLISRLFFFKVPGYCLHIQFDYLVITHFNPIQSKD